MDKLSFYDNQDYYKFDAGQHLPNNCVKIWPF